MHDQIYKIIDEYAREPHDISEVNIDKFLGEMDPDNYMEGHIMYPN